MRSDDRAERELADLKVLPEVQRGAKLRAVRIRLSRAVDCAELDRAPCLVGCVAAADHRIRVVAILRCIARVASEVHAITTHIAVAAVFRIGVFVARIQTAHEVFAPAIIRSDKEAARIGVRVQQVREIRRARELSIAQRPSIPVCRHG